MIKLTATALIHYISPVIEIPPRTPGGQGFAKRELILDDSWEKDGKTYPNFVLIEFTGDKIALLDSFVPGQLVTVEAFINGREYQGRYYNTVKGMSIAPYQAQQTSPATVGQRSARPAPGGYPQQPIYTQVAGGYPQQPQYPQQGGYPQIPTPTPMPGTPQGGNLGPDGLPFR